MLAKNTKKKSKSKQKPFPVLEMAPSNKSNQLVLKEKLWKNRSINSSFRNFELSILIIDAF